MLPQLLRLDRIDKLPLNFRLLAKRALKTNAHAAVAAVAQASKLVDSTQQVHFVPVFYNYLDPKNIPTMAEVVQLSSLEWRQQTEPYLSINEVMGEIIDAGNILPHPSKSRDLFAALWERLWPWARFIFDCYDCHPEFTAHSPKPSLFSNFICLARMFGQDAQTLQMVLSTPGFRRNLAEAWSLVSIANKSLLGGERRLAILLTIIWKYFMQHPPSEAAHLREILDGVGGTVEAFAATLTSHMEIVAEVEHMDMTNVRCTLAFIALIDKTLYPDSRPGPLARAACRAGILVYVLQMLSIIVNSWAKPQYESRPTEDDVVAALHTSYTFMLDVFRHAPGDYELYAKTVGLLLLYSVGRVVIFVRAPQVRELVMPLVHAFMPGVLLDFYSVIELADALDNYEKLIKRNTPVVPLSEEWNELMRIVEDRVGIAETCVPVNDFPQRACDNLECGKITKLRQCVGCKDVYYCSKSCQKRDWEFGDHRTDCAARPSLRLTKKHGFRQRCFLRAIVQKSYQDHRASFIATKHELDGIRFETPIHPYRDSALCTRFDFSTVEADVTMMPFDDARSLPPAVRSDPGRKEAWVLAGAKARMFADRYALQIVKPPKQLTEGGMGWPEVILVALRTSAGVELSQ